MPRAPRKRAASAPPIVTEGEEIELANLNLPPQMTAREEQREREVEEFAAELGSTGRVKVWSVIEGRATYAGDMSADGFTLDALLDTYGGGDKSLVFMQGKEKVETVRVSLDPTIPPKNPRVKAAPPQANGAADMSNMMALMMKSSMDNAQAMSTMMTGIVGALTAVMTATKPTTDPLATALQIVEAMKPAGGNGAGNMVEAMSLLREGIKLGEQLGGKEDDGMMTVVGKGMDTLGVLVAGIVESQRNKTNAPTQPALPSGMPPGVMAPTDGVPHADAQAFPNTGEQPPVSVRPWVDAARPNIGALLNASKFLPPHAAASAIDNMLSDEQFEDLMNDIQDPDGGGFGVRLREYFPAHIDDNTDAHWIGEVVRILLTEFVEEDGATEGDGNG